MKRLLFVSLLVISPWGWTSTTATVEMKSLGYAPKRVEVTLDQPVVWKNTAYTEHSATSDAAPPVFDTGMISPGKESKPVHFEKAGTYPYHCLLHGKSMSGVVVVKASGR